MLRNIVFFSMLFVYLASSSVVKKDAAEKTVKGTVSKPEEDRNEIVAKMPEMLVKKIKWKFFRNRL